MNIVQFLKENTPKLISSEVQVSPNISEGKLKSAIKSYANGISSEQVIVLHDSTLLKNAKEGLLFLGDRFYLKSSSEKPIMILYKDLLEIRINPQETKKRNKGKENLNVILTTKDEQYVLTEQLSKYEVEKFVKLIEGIISIKSTQDFVDTSQIMPLSDMPEPYKLTYVKVLVNFIMSDKNRVDAIEYRELMSLVTRIHLNSEYRLKLREFIGSSEENREETTSLLTILKEKANTIDFSIVQKSLFKDLLYLYKLKNDLSSWESNEFLSRLRHDFSIQIEEVELLCAAIKNDEDILKFRKNDADIIKSMKDIALQSNSIGMPLTAVYLSGSVVGLNAVSGLAALGVGALGFAAMVPGIGLFALLGMGTYHGWKKFTNIDHVENNKQREYMLQKIIRNAQQTIDYLIEDINEISCRLVAAIQKGNENSEKINQLSDMLTMLSESARFSAEKQKESQKEQMLTRLPLTLSIDRLEELTSKVTHSEIREFILDCYKTKPEQEIAIEVLRKTNQRAILVDSVQVNDGFSKVHSSNDSAEKISEDYVKTQTQKLEINENLSLEDLENLQESFEKIGYFELTSGGVAEVTGSAKRIAKKLFGDR
ncbi:hypothetical protein [Exiguobacterium sp. S22-S28]|uniref:hypothetical protein n=1 Tax=Exiguobacterium sp. S22-S28 TaxID=3342768 RepID=UPI00372D7AE4